MLLFQKFQVIYPILNENIHFVEYEQICEYSSGKKTQQLSPANSEL